MNLRDRLFGATARLGDPARLAASPRLIALRAIAPDLATGLRAATATVVPFSLASLHGRPELAWMAVGGWLGTLADPGGSRGARAQILGAFAVAGALVVAGGEGVPRLPAAVASALLLATFVFTMLRALGAAGQSLGMMLAIVSCLGLSARAPVFPRDPLWFAAGALLAVVLSSVVWPVWTHWPVRRAVADVAHELSAYALALERCAASGAPESDERWVELARRHTRRVRESLEEARAMSLAVHARRAGESRLGGNLRVLLGLLESQCMTLVSLASALETVDGETRALGRAELTACAATYEAIGVILLAPSVKRRDVASVRASLAPPPPTSAASVPPEVSDGITPTTVAQLSAILEQESRQALSVAGALDRADPSLSPETAAKRELAIVVDLGVLRDALSPRSPIFRHAIRVAGASALAALLGAVVSPRHTAWVTLATLVILQPYTGATVRRAAERMGGTFLGGLLAIAVASVTVRPLALGAVMFPLSIAAVVTRRRSYSLFTFFLTPIFVLVATTHPGDWSTAAARAGDTILGGAIALLASLVVFPGFEERSSLPEALSAMVLAVDAYAAMVLGALDATHRGTLRHVHEARRQAGIAIGVAESALERVLAEPRTHGRGEERATELVTFARRLTVSMSTLETLANKRILPDDVRRTMIGKARKLSALMRHSAADAGPASM